ncbi:MAG: ATP-binding protein [Thiofilum sp.]|uniref:sensor histidine kinase n=1 Tax=Thiofilum sp. TaxID=2212733 RepID=UPI0025E02B10|nr:ATP-binding protein [Thiofilum sp.]MBK8451724.1 sensor histidine kinase N-terminal domain-containing protein [Thiofilum sp.]
MMKRSIHWQLIISLSLGLSMAAFLAGWAIYNVAQQEANKLFDYYLQQAALFIPYRLDEDAEYSEKDLLGEDIFVEVWNPEGELIYSSSNDFTMPRYKTLGFQNVQAFDSYWRVYTTSRRGHYIQVAQPESKRDLLAKNLALRSLSPFILLIPLLLFLTGWIVRRNLRPLKQMTVAITQRNSNDLAPLSSQDQPQELVPITDALNGLLARLEQTLKAQHTFIADASHELRSPLTALKLQIQLAERAKTEPQRLQAIQKLGERIERAIYLVEQLLTLARHDMPDLEKEWVTLNNLVSYITQDYQVSAKSHQLELILELPQQPLTILANESALTILLKNLLDNAIKYTPAGGMIKVGLATNPLHIKLWVEDSGIGIPELERPYVFERFYRASNHQAAGTGLGLAIVHNIVQQLGASIQLSVPVSGKGLIVQVQFPLSLFPFCK